MLRIIGGCGGGSVIAGPFKKRLGRALYEFEAYTDPAEGTHSLTTSLERQPRPLKTGL